jgi:hypothetical protein
LAIVYLSSRNFSGRISIPGYCNRISAWVLDEGSQVISVWVCGGERQIY